MFLKNIKVHLGTIETMQVRLFFDWTVHHWYDIDLINSWYAEIIIYRQLNS